MTPSRQRRRAAGRKASPSLRALAALVVALLAASSLGEVAHSWLVPHAVCAEHGELLELSTDSHDAGPHHADTAPAAGRGPAVTEEGAASHDHCEVLASGQEQLALPAASVVALLPATATSSLALVESSTAILPLSTLSVAPKTSPPARGVVA